MALAGRLERNLARTMPLFPWARVTFPQITRVLLGLPPGVTVLLRKERTRTAEHTTHSSVWDQAGMGLAVQPRQGTSVTLFHSHL